MHSIFELSNAVFIVTGSCSLRTPHSQVKTCLIIQRISTETPDCAVDYVLNEA